MGNVVGKAASAGSRTSEFRSCNSVREEHFQDFQSDLHIISS